MNNIRYLQKSGSSDNRYTYKSALGEDDIRMNPFKQCNCLRKALKNSERIGKVFRIKVPAQLTRRNSKIWDIKIFYQLLLNSCIRTNIENFKSCFLKCRNQRNIWCNMACASSTCKYNSLCSCIAHFFTFFQIYYAFACFIASSIAYES